MYIDAAARLFHHSSASASIAAGPDRKAAKYWPLPGKKQPRSRGDRL
jgi:hypothetical protein